VDNVTVQLSGISPLLVLLLAGLLLIPLLARSGRRRAPSSDRYRGGRRDAYDSSSHGSGYDAYDSRDEQHDSGGSSGDSGGGDSGGGDSGGGE
jgi:hypothetical protein